MKTKQFKVQIPTNIVRSNVFSATEFVLIAKLIQAYYLQTNKSFIFEVDHKKLMYHMSIEKNDTLKKYLNSLYENKIILNKIDRLPRKSGMKIEMNENLINSDLFTQLDVSVISKKAIDKIGYVGIRLLYYYASYIDVKTKKYYSHVGIETIQQELGLSNKTICEYNKKLEQAKLIKIDRNIIDHAYYNTSRGERLLFTKHNNHYFVRKDNIAKLL